MICRHGLGLLGSLLSSHFKDVKTEAKRGKHSLQIGSGNNGNTESSFQIPETDFFHCLLVLWLEYGGDVYILTGGTINKQK